MTSPIHHAVWLLTGYCCDVISKKIEYNYVLGSLSRGRAYQGLGHISGMHLQRRVDENDRELRRDRSCGLKAWLGPEKLKLGILLCSTQLRLDSKGTQIHENVTFWGTDKDRQQLQGYSDKWSLRTHQNRRYVEEILYWHSHSFPC